MNAPRKLKSPPIDTALIELRFRPSSTLSIEDLEKKLRTTFENHTIKAAYSAKVTVDSKIKAPVVDNFGVIGFEVFTKDGRHRAKFETTRMSFHVKKDYSDFDDLRKNTFDYLEKIFVTADREILIQRIGVRFINKLQVDRSSGLSFLTYAPRAPVGINSEVITFSHDFFSHYPKTSIYSKVKLEMSQGETDKSLGTFVFDIDVFEVLDMKYNEKGLTTKLDKLRLLKNSIFFGNLSEEGIKKYG